MDAPPPVFLRALGVLTFLFSSISALFAAADAGIITRRGADVRGTIEGALQVTSDGEIQVAPGASISGELLVPPDKASRGRPDAKPSGKTVVNNRGGASAIRGDVRVSEGFELPHVHPPKEKRGGESKVMAEQYIAGLDFTKIRAFTVKHPRARVSLPPDAYGEFIVSEGTLMLGSPGVTDTIRYDFQKLQVESGARVEVLSPVVVSIADGASWLGALGDRKTTFWLDVRVARGGVLLGSGAAFHGHLAAPRSPVTISNRAVFTGGLVSDHLVVESGAKVSVEDPVWNAESADGRAPTLAHRALRLQREIPKLRRATKARYSPGVSYIEDVPYIMLAASGAPSEGEDRGRQEQEAVFEAFRSALVESGFSQARIVLTDSAASGGAPSVRNLVLTRAEFDGLMTELGGKAAAAENLQAVAADPALLERFLQRVVTRSAASAAGR